MNEGVKIWVVGNRKQEITLLQPTCQRRRYLLTLVLSFTFAFTANFCRTKICVVGLFPKLCLKHPRPCIYLSILYNSYNAFTEPTLLLCTVYFLCLLTAKKHLDVCVLPGSNQIIFVLVYC
ncbi:hypothetical protein FKM82_031302 [Ascaphus truei]